MSASLKYYLQIVGGPPSEKKLLESSLIVGSELDVKESGLEVHHAHLSAEHCTFYLQSGVLSVIDHNSDHGVAINGQRIPPNKMIILLPSDEVKLGHLKVLLFPYKENTDGDNRTQVISIQDLQGTNNAIQEKDWQETHQLKKALELNDDGNDLEITRQNISDPLVMMDAINQHASEMTVSDLSLSGQKNLKTLNKNSSIDQTHSKITSHSASTTKKELSLDGEDDWVQLENKENQGIISEHENTDQFQLDQDDSAAATQTFIDVDTEVPLEQTQSQIILPSRTAASILAVGQSVAQTQPLAQKQGQVQSKTASFTLAQDNTKVLSQKNKQNDVQEEKKPIAEVTNLHQYKRSQKIHESASDKLSEASRIIQNPLKLKKKMEKNREKVKKLSSQYEFNQLDSVQYPVRLLSFIIDVLLGMRFSIYLIEVDYFQILNPLSDFVGFALDFVGNLYPPLGNPLIEMAPHISPLLAGYIFLRVIFNLVFGASPGQLMLLCWNDGNPILKRILGPFREMIGFILGPLLIFDFPALFGKKTVKEMITMTGLDNFSNRLSTIIGIILIPVVYAGCFLHPFLGDALFKPPVIDNISNFLNSDLNPSNMPIVGEVNNSYFFAGQFSFDKTKLQTLPGFHQVKGSNNKKIFVPRISFYEVQNQNFLRIERGKLFELKDRLTEMLRLWPILQQRFPETYRFTLGTKFNQSGFISEVKTLVETSLTISLAEVPWLTLSYGPSLSPFLFLRSELSKLFDGESITKLSYYKVGKREFLRFEVEKGLIRRDTSDYYLLPLSSQRSYAYDISERATDDKIWKTLVFSNFKQNGKIKNAMGLMKAEKTTLNSFELIDFYSLKDSAEDVNTLVAPLIYRHYFSLGLSALKSNSEKFKEDYVLTLTKFLSMQADLNKAKTEVAREQLIKKLSAALEAFKGKDESYFTVAPSW